MLQRATQVLLDAARMGNFMVEAKERNKSHESLYRGASNERLEAVAPYLFPFGWNSPFANWVLRAGWGSSWGVLLKSAYPLPELHKHFRKFLKVQTEDGKSLYFRFYDPRVLRIFLPTCDSAQIREFFGGAIDYFMVEDEDPQFALRFTHQNGVLQTERLPVKELIAALPEPTPLPPPPEDPLPAETIEALKELGIILPEGATMSTLQAALEGSAGDSMKDNTSEPTPVPQTTAVQPSVSVAPNPAPSFISSAPTPTPSTPSSPKPKTKWNTFE